jgi:orotidine-5'-phosphate decarboxylase
MPGRSAVSVADESSMRQRPPDNIPVRDRLIVALDVESREAASRLVDELGETVNFYKIGLGLQFRGGIDLATDLKARGKKIFFDSKIYDIEATTKAAVQSIAELGVDFVTVHGNTSILTQAVAGRGTSNLKIFAITVLTSLDDLDMREMGYTVSVEKMVDYKTRSAIAAGCDGVIASGLEARMIRQIADETRMPSLLIAAPGIRSAGVSRDDQKRVSTPESAIESGADYVVMGRQIVRAKNPRDEAKRVLDAIANALP